MAKTPIGRGAASGPANGSANMSSFRALFDPMPIAVVIDRPGLPGHMYVNPAYMALRGLTDYGTALLEPPETVLHPDDFDKAVRNVVSIMSGSGPLDDARYRFFRADGHVIDVDVYSVRIEFDGEPALYSVLIDASRLRQAEEFAGSLVSAIPIGMHFWRLEDDDRLILTGANPAADAILGFDHGALVGKEIGEAFPALVDGDIPARYARIAREGGVWHEESVAYEDQRVASSFDVHAFRTGPNEMVAAFTDITERKRAEVDLKAAHDLQAAVFASMHDGFSLLDSHGVHQYVNPALCAMTGFDADELVGVGPPHPYWPPEEYDTIGKALERSTSDDAKEFELTFMRKSGERFPVLVTPSVVRDANGGAASVFATVRDMTEWKRSATALERSMRSLAEAERMGGTGSWEYDVASDTAEWSENMFRLFDVDPQTPRELVFKEFVEHLVHPDDRERLLTAFRGALAGVSAYDVEYRVVRQDGSVRDIHAVAETLRDEDGRAVRMIGRVEDITERKRAETELSETRERLQAILDNAPMLVYVMDTDGRFVLVNRAAQDLLDLSSSVVGRTREDVLPPDTAAAHRANDIDVIRKRRPIVFEERNTQPDGEHVYLSTKFPVFDMEHRVVGVCGISADITGRKMIEDELARYRESLETLVQERTAQLEEASRAKSAFLASMSHELRTPLNSIIGFTGIMLQGLSGDLTTEQRAQLTMVNRAGRQLLGLVGDVLDLSRIEAGRVELDIDCIDVPRLVQSLAETVDPMARDVGLTLQVDVGDAPGTMRTDRRKLEQILLNLLSNAVKYTDEGGIALTVTDLGHGRVSFAVRDTGIGIAAEDHERVFDEFRQLPAVREAKHPGSGLGLAISRQLAELLGGSIELESALGKGSTFTLVLPLDPPPTSDE